MEFSVAVDVEVFIGDHVGDDEGLDFGEGAILGPLGGEMASAVEGVGGGPGTDGLFAIVEDQPDAVALGRVRAKVVADLDEQSCSGGTVVGSDEADVLERVVGLVVAGQDDDAVLLARIAHDEVAHGEQAGGGAGGEAVDLEVALGCFGGEVRLDELFGFGVVGRADPPMGSDVEDTASSGRRRPVR